MTHVQTILAGAVVVAALVLLGLLWEHGVLAEIARRVMKRSRRRGPAGNESMVPGRAAFPLPGTPGLAATALRPFGRVVVAGTEYEAKSRFGFIDAGARVTVIGEAAGALTVRADG